MNSKTKLLAVISLITASVIWGATSPVMKLTLQEIPVFSLAFIRFGVASFLLLPFVFKKLSINKNDWLTVFVCALCGVTLNIMFFFWGLKLTTAINSGIIIGSLPIFTLLAASFFLKEKIAKNLIMGGLLGIAGIGVIIGKDLITTGFTVSPTGDLLILLATLAFVAYEIISKRLFKIYNPLVITFYSFLIGALTFAPFALTEYMQNPLWTINLSTKAMVGIGYGIFLSSLAAYSLWQWGLSKIPASRVGFFFYLDPIVATVSSVVLLSEKITVPFLIGAGLIFAGLFFSQGHFPYHPKFYKKQLSLE